MSIVIGITGGRDYQGRNKVFEVLDEFLALEPEITLIVGDARGADKWAREWALERKVTFPNSPTGFVAHWNKYGKVAGRFRNKEMSQQNLDLLIAFPGGTGTKHMTEICKDLNIEILQIE